MNMPDSLQSLGLDRGGSKLAVAVDLRVDKRDCERVLHMAQGVGKAMFWTNSERLEWDVTRPGATPF